MIKLSVNVNKIAVIRNSRGGDIHKVVEAARVAIAAGCHGITVHPRPDARHITARDVFDLALMLTAEFAHIELNIEGYPGQELLELVTHVRPTQCTMVPDPPGVLTSNAGWNLASGAEWLREVIARLRDDGIRTSLFIAPEPDTVLRARELGADRVELFTGPYAHAFGTAPGRKLLAMHREAARVAHREGLGVNAGHDLNLANIPDYVKAVANLDETSIGHALISDAIYMGLDRAVKAYLTALGAHPMRAAGRRGAAIIRATRKSRE
ncbi:MAG TPA: pyridoxine 5'-phosphate synthase [Candidatus Binataceae bacterium]|nr:pyridoxine 5'-phosphate synthase [Candidatus Binataceae bacterium]